MAENDDMKVTAEFPGGVMRMRLAEWDLIAEAAERCGATPAEFMLSSALAAAQKIVPLACQPHVGAQEKELPGLFQKNGGG